MSTIDKAFLLIKELDRRVKILESPKAIINKRDERLKVKEALKQEKYADLIKQGGHGVITAIAEELSNDLGYNINYSTVYYILRGN